MSPAGVKSAATARRVGDHIVALALRLVGGDSLRLGCFGVVSHGCYRVVQIGLVERANRRPAPSLRSSFWQTAIDQIRAFASRQKMTNARCSSIAFAET